MYFRSLAYLLFIGFISNAVLGAEDAAATQACLLNLTSLVEAQAQQIADLRRELQVLEIRNPPEFGSVQVVVPLPKPGTKCTNCCGPCNAHWTDWEIPAIGSFGDPEIEFYRRHLCTCRDKGIDTVVFTGATEPQQNPAFLDFFGDQVLGWFDLDNPHGFFRKVELQTTGTELNPDFIARLRDRGRVNRINLSTFALDDTVNQSHTRTPKALRVDIKQVAQWVREAGLGLRLSLNFTDYYNNISAEEILRRAAVEFGADQLTIRKILASGPIGKDDVPLNRQDAWTKLHRGSQEKLDEIFEYIRTHGKLVGVLPFGAFQYSLFGMSVAIDGNCMNVGNYHARYLTLYPPNKLKPRAQGLFRGWRDEGNPF